MLQSVAKYETFLCIGNIGTAAGVVHVNISGAGSTGDGSSVIVQSCSQSLLGGLTFAALDRASIAGGGVVAVMSNSTRQLSALTLRQHSPATSPSAKGD